MCLALSKRTSSHSFCSPCLKAPTLYILDNASIHRATKCLERPGPPTFKESAGSNKINLIYAVPYGPRLNRVESCFNSIRQYVNRRKPRTDMALHKALEDAVHDLRGSSLPATFEKVCMNLFRLERSKQEVWKRVHTIVATTAARYSPRHLWITFAKAAHHRVQRDKARLSQMHCEARSYCCTLQSYHQAVLDSLLYMYTEANAYGAARLYITNVK